jgi:TPR repeat protein
VELYERSCTLGEEYGCYRLGVCHELGTGVPADPDRAHELYALACEGGAKQACGEMGAYFELRDRELAAGFYRRACADGDRASCDGLRRIYETF